MGPGGLDPVEVFAGLPKELQDCFEKKDIKLLQTTLEKMDPVQASKYLNDCIGSGMWLPNVNKTDDSEGGDELSGEELNEAEEPVYEKCGDEAN